MKSQLLEKLFQGLKLARTRILNGKRLYRLDDKGPEKPRLRNDQSVFDKERNYDRHHLIWSIHSSLEVGAGHGHCSKAWAGLHRPSWWWPRAKGPCATGMKTPLPWPCAASQRLSCQGAWIKTKTGRRLSGLHHFALSPTGRTRASFQGSLESARRHDHRRPTWSAPKKQATTALITALDAVSRAANKKNIMVTASLTSGKPRAPTFYEMWFGDGAASVAVGNGDDVIAEFLGSYSASPCDFNDHYRGASFNRLRLCVGGTLVQGYGLQRILSPRLSPALMEKAGRGHRTMSDKLVYPCFFKARNIKRSPRNWAQLRNRSSATCTRNAASAAWPIAFVMLAFPPWITPKAGERIHRGGGLRPRRGRPGISRSPTRLKSPNWRTSNGFAGTIANKKIVDNYAKYLAQVPRPPGKPKWASAPKRKPRPP